MNFAKFLRTPFWQNSSGCLLMWRDYLTFRSSHQSCSIKKVFLEVSQNSKENNCTIVSILIKLQVSGLQLLEKESLAQVFSCEFYEICKNTFFTEHLWTTASVPWKTNLPSYPRRPFNLSSYFKQTLRNKPLGKLFSNSTINHGNSFFQLFIIVRETLFLAWWGRHFNNIILVMRNFIFMKIIILTFQSFNRRQEKIKWTYIKKF